VSRARQGPPWGKRSNGRRIPLNPAELAKPPRVEEEEVEPFEAEDIHGLLQTAPARRNGVRYVVALALGIRQGQALGLKWSRLDKETRTLQVQKAIQRRTWQHGCANPHPCGAQYHKTKPCKPGCKRHHRPCPPPCPPDCTDHARWCPQRHGGGLVEVDVKSQAGRRGIALPDELFTLITAHRTMQQRERENAGSEWHADRWIFTQPNGKPIDPRRDHYEWKALLAEAGVREARLHDARHTAATVLLLLGVHERAVEAAVTAMLDDARGWRLAELRKRRGLTQEQVATRMGVSVARVSQIEAGDVSTQDVLNRYVAALGGTLKLIADFGDEQLKIA
jgi:integrase